MTALALADRLYSQAGASVYRAQDGCLAQGVLAGLLSTGYRADRADRTGDEWTVELSGPCGLAVLTGLDHTEAATAVSLLGGQR